MSIIFDWLIEIEKPQLPFKPENGELIIERVQSETVLSNMSEVCQFFASIDVISGSDSLTILPSPTEDAITTIMNDIAPHYLEVKKIYIDGELIEINVRCLKKESKKMMEAILSNGVYPVIPDLYRTQHINMPTEQRELTYYSVNKEMICPLHSKETEELKEFLESSFFARDGSVSLQPRGWRLEYDLKESVSLRTFSAFTEQMIIVIDSKDKSVVGLDIYK